MFKRKSIDYKHDPITPQASEEILASLAEIEDKLQAVAADIDRNQARMAGMHSTKMMGDYGVQSDFLASAQKNLIKKRETLLVRLDVISTGLAHIALDDDYLD